jgi:hypothetical protein
MHQIPHDPAMARLQRLGLLDIRYQVTQRGNGQGRAGKLTWRSLLFLSGTALACYGCSKVEVQDWPVGETCIRRNCYQVVIRSEVRKTRVWEGESTEETLSDEIRVSRRVSGGRSTDFPAIRCKRRGACIDRRIELADCGAVAIPLTDASMFRIEGHEVSSIPCPRPLSIGEYPQPLN